MAIAQPTINKIEMPGKCNSFKTIEITIIPIPIDRIVSANFFPLELRSVVEMSSSSKRSEEVVLISFLGKMNETTVTTSPPIIDTVAPGQCWTLKITPRINKVKPMVLKKFFILRIIAR